jgi:hypothetical protein
LIIGAALVDNPKSEYMNICKCLNSGGPLEECTYNKQTGIYSSLFLYSYYLLEDVKRGLK